MDFFHFWHLCDLKIYSFYSVMDRENLPVPTNIIELNNVERTESNIGRLVTITIFDVHYLEDLILDPQDTFVLHSYSVTHLIKKEICLFMTHF